MPRTKKPPIPRGDKFGIMFRMQQTLQLKINKDRPLEDFSEAEHIQELKENAFALMAELYEAFGEVGWKPWAKSRHFNGKGFKSELVDMFKFFLNMMLHAGMTPRELFEGFLEKDAKNHERADTGYDGIKTKCPTCKREYSDQGVLCSPGIHIDPGITSLQAIRQVGTISRRKSRAPLSRVS